MSTACFYSKSKWMKDECKSGLVVWCISSPDSGAYSLCPPHAIWFKQFYSGYIEIVDEDVAWIHNLMLR